MKDRFPYCIIHFVDIIRDSMKGSKYLLLVGFTERITVEQFTCLAIDNGKNANMVGS